MVSQLPAPDFNLIVAWFHSNHWMMVGQPTSALIVFNCACFSQALDGPAQICSLTLIVSLHGFLQLWMFSQPHLSAPDFNCYAFNCG
jgi:hypothetical protein